MQSQPGNLINLESLINFSARLNETYDRDLILNSAILSLMGKLKISKSCALIPIADSGYRIILVKGRNPINLLDSLSEILPRNTKSISEAEELLKKNGFMLFLPIIYQSITHAVICLGSKLNNEDVSEEEEHYINLVATITANSLQNALNHQSLIEEKNRVEQRNQLLTALFDLSKDFSNLLSREQIIKMLAYHLMGQLMITRFALYLTPNDNEHEVIFNRFTEEPNAEIVAIIKQSNTVIRQPDLIDGNALKDFMQRNEICVLTKMMIQGRVLGILAAGKRMNKQEYTDENIQFIEAIGNTTISAIENGRLFEEELEKFRLEGELNLALDIQQNLLPKSVPVVENFSISGVSYPSRHVGGDYFDFINLNSGLLLIAIADVSGKGMPASLIMANVQAALRLIAHMPLSLVDLTRRINKLIFENTGPDKFITFFCGILDPREKSFRYVNAGHNPPILLRNNMSVRRLTEGGLILGIFEEPFDYQQGIIGLDKGDILLLYTDGVSEAFNAEEEEFGEDKIIDFLKENCGLEAETIQAKLVNTIREFTCLSGQSDDLTCIVIKAD